METTIYTKRMRKAQTNTKLGDRTTLEWIRERTGVKNLVRHIAEQDGHGQNILHGARTTDYR